MSSNWGRNIKLSLFGESHGESIGVVLDGIPPNIEIDLDEVRLFMARRAPGKAKHSTPRKESDLVSIQSGFYKGKTTGTPLCGIIKNNNTRSQDYQAMPLRPSHGDYTGSLRYNNANDPRGGGHFSGRLTAPLCFAGTIAKQILATMKIQVGGHIASIGTICDDSFNPLTIEPSLLQELQQKDFPVINENKGIEMIGSIEEARLSLDSMGGIVSCCAIGVPAGIGSPMFGGVENVIASLIYGIPAVRGIEFGTGFKASSMRGSEHNDSFYLDNTILKTKTNHHGGIIGGITTGMPILLNVAIKPTPSIATEQETVDIASMKETLLEIHGRHDPCIVPRAVPVVEACVALALLDCLLEGGNPVAIRELSKRN